MTIDTLKQAAQALHTHPIFYQGVNIMRKLAIVFLFLISLPCFGQTYPPAMTTWAEGSVIGYNPDQSKTPTVIFNVTTAPVNTCPGYDGTDHAFSPCNFAPDQWVDIPLAQFGIPADVKAVVLQGIMIITPGTVPGTPDLMVQCRAPGSTFASGQKLGQVIAEDPSVGARTNASFLCPVVNGNIEVWWHHELPGSTTDDSSYGLNFSIQTYIR